MFIFLKRLKLFYFLVPFFLFFSGAAYSEQQTLKVATDQWCPYACDPKSGQEGFGIDLLRQIFSRHDIEIDYVILPWHEALLGVENGEYDIALGAFKSDSDKLVYPDHFFAHSTNCVFVRETDKRLYTDIEDFDYKKIGASESYSYGVFWDNYLRNERSDVFFSTDSVPAVELLTMLNSAELEAIVDDESVMYYEARKLGYKDFRKAICTASARVYMGFSPVLTNVKRYVDIFDDGFDQLLQSRRYEEIRDMY